MSSPDAELLEASRIGDTRRAAALQAELAEMDPFALKTDSERLAFWINLYNARVLREFKERPRRGHLIRHRKVFDAVSVRVGTYGFTLNVIEHGLMRLNSRPPGALRRTMRSDDERLRAAPTALDPRIHFALNCAATSCPPVRAYECSLIDEQLEQASRAYIQAETGIRRNPPAIWLPYLMKLYRKDFGEMREILTFTADHLADSDAEWLRAQTAEPADAGRMDLNWSDYDWTIAS